MPCVTLEIAKNKRERSHNSYPHGVYNRVERTDMNQHHKN